LFHYPLIGPLPVLPQRANVFTVPDLSFIHYPDLHIPYNRDAWRSHLENHIVPYGDAILTFSEHTRQDLAKTYGVHPDRIHVTPLAAGEQFRPVRERRELDADLERFNLRGQRYILSVGTLEPRKNLELLLRAYSRLVRGRPALPQKLVLAGARGWLEAPIFAAVESLGLQDRVVFLGHSNPLAVLYNGADLMVYPSLFEGFGLPPLEAMSCGTPVITSNSSSLPEVVGDAGIQVDPQDEEELCAAMRRVLEDDALRHHLSEAGLKRSREFSWDRTAAITLKAYEAALARRPFPSACASR
jgi:glycosyltransferase involved in cell wall biosynthesis